MTNLAAFGVIAMLGARDRANDSLRDYAGLWHSNPGLAALMTVCLLSLGGLPPTAGIGKVVHLSGGRSAGYYWLAIIGVLTSVVSVFFYLRVVVMMYGRTRGCSRASTCHRLRYGGAGAVHCCHLLSRHPADAHPRFRRQVDRDDLLEDQFPTPSNCQPLPISNSQRPNNSRWTLGFGSWAWLSLVVRVGVRAVSGAFGTGPTVPHSIDVNAIVEPPIDSCRTLDC